MSHEKRQYQAKRWLLTAEDDWQASQALLESGFYAQACFYAQQSAEKAVKALWYHIDAEPWGHSIQRLVTEFAYASDIENLDDWVELAALLDKFYIPTRYPNGLPDLTPGQVYRLREAKEAVAAAQEVIAACRRWIEEKPD